MSVSARNVRVVLRSRPEGAPREENFEVIEAPLPAVGPGQVLRRTIWLSVDPYMRGRMSAVKSYAPPVPLGEPMVGATVSQVVHSADPRFAAGDFVLGDDGWQSYAVGDGAGLRKLDPWQAPISWSLGVFGMPGLTAYVALLDLGSPASGETVVVSAAAGAVGSVAGQIAKLKGCRVVGTAGSDEKCAHVTRDLGFDACINYRSADLGAALDAACPDGIDVYVDQVGGTVLAAVLQRINVHARISLVGQMSHANDVRPAPGPGLLPLVVRRATLRGMLVSDHAHRTPDFLRDMTRWVREGAIHYREDVVVGLASAPRALLGLFAGENVGKRIVQVSADPTRR